MSELTQKQLKQRWVDIKKQINQRQLLAFRVGIPLDDWDNYMNELPGADEINRIYQEIRDDRRKKTLRIKVGLSKIVGYRESKEFSRKSGVSDTSIRQIIEGKKEMAGYDIINRLELFLNRTIPDFELSIENPLDIKSYSQEHLGEIAIKINRTADNLKQYCFKLTQMARKNEKETDWQGTEIQPTDSLKYSIGHLSELKDDIDSFWKVYIDGRIE